MSTNGIVDRSPLRNTHLYSYGCCYNKEKELDLIGTPTPGAGPTKRKNSKSLLLHVGTLSGHLRIILSKLTVKFIKYVKVWGTK